MKKLTNNKLQRIIARKTLGFSTKIIADKYGISERRVQQIYGEFKAVGKPHYLKKPGKQAKPITKEDEKTVLEAYKTYKVGAKYLERIIFLPHNRIHMILKKNGLSNNEPKKQKRRKWVRYEREHSLSLVHLDWHEYKGKQIIFVEDDASRIILAGG